MPTARRVEGPTGRGPVGRCRGGHLLPCPRVLGHPFTSQGPMDPQSSMGPTLRSSRIGGPAFIWGACKVSPPTGEKRKISAFLTPRETAQCVALRTSGETEAGSGLGGCPRFTRPLRRRGVWDAALGCGPGRARVPRAPRPAAPSSAVAARSPEDRGRGAGGASAQAQRAGGDALGARARGSRRPNSARRAPAPRRPPARPPGAPAGEGRARCMALGWRGRRAAEAAAEAEAARASLGAPSGRRGRAAGAGCGRATRSSRAPSWRRCSAATRCGWSRRPR